ncbi:hypothetical protein, partial [Microvirga makkahensis]
RVDAVADAPRVMALDVAGREDEPIGLDLSAALADTDGSEELSAVFLSGLPDGFTLSHGTIVEGDKWQVPADKLPELCLTPPQNWNGTLQLTLYAMSVETASHDAATASATFTVTVAPVNDAPELALTPPEHSGAGARTASAIGGVEAQDIDSDHLSGASVVLSDAHPGDTLTLEGFELRTEEGRVMIGDTGIELVGGGYDSQAGSLTLSGNASPDIYAEVLRSLMLESADASGLAAGVRSIEVTLLDNEGASSKPSSVEVVVDDVAQPSSDTTEGSFATTMSGPAQDDFRADILLLMSNSDGDTSDTIGGSWTDHTEPKFDAAAPDPLAEHEHPVSDSIQSVSDFHVDIGRVNWS